MIQSEWSAHGRTAEAGCNCPARNDLGSRTDGSVVHKLDGDAFLDDAGAVASIEQLADGPAASLAVVERPVVDVHADESAGPLAVETSRIPHCVIQGLRSMLQSIRDA